MAQKLNSSLLLFIILAGLHLQCRKYEENPLINLKTRSMRLENQEFYISDFTIDGIDSLSSLAPLPNHTPMDYFIRFFVAFSHEEFINGKYFDGTYSWADHKQSLYIYASNSSFKTGPFSERNSEKWKITKLTNHQLHLETIHKGKKYVVHLYSK